MRHWKITIGTVGLMLALSVQASAVVVPKDLPTIEALIALHKAVKKDEDQATQRVAMSFGEQSLEPRGQTSSTRYALLSTPGWAMHIPIWCWQVPSRQPPIPCTSWSGTTRILPGTRSSRFPKSPSWHGTMRMPMSPFPGR